MLGKAPLMPGGTRSSIVLAALAMALMTPAAARGDKDRNDEDADRGKPRLKLAAEPSVGFTPVTVVLTAQLTGVSPSDAGFCHPAVTWVRVNPGIREDDAMRYHRDAACRHPENEAVAMTSFTKTLTLRDVGPYLFRLIVETGDGRRVESAYARVQVLRVQ